MTTSAFLGAVTQTVRVNDVPPLETINHPVLLANGDNDIMVPTINSLALARRIPNARLSIFLIQGWAGSSRTMPNFCQKFCRSSTPHSL